MNSVNPKIEESIYDYIVGNLEKILKSRYGERPTPGVPQYAFIANFGKLSANDLRDDLIDLEQKGMLEIVEERAYGLRYYTPK
ncbi:MAG: hypothetical protein DRP06_01120 [Candidatus Aenigmatarchaeota archaeon]|nr:MAG: hypothetical protein DRP06_01120 [Candidatus Aenigmarchaeota archaeon]